eukprot:SAG31_NODE_23_length_33717_cov_17.863585_30_plen_56_part_00
MTAALICLFVFLKNTKFRFRYELWCCTYILTMGVPIDLINLNLVPRYRYTLEVQD